MRIRLLILSLAAVCFVATPSMADLFGFSVSNPSNSYDGAGTFKSVGFSGTTADLYRNFPSPTTTAEFTSATGWGTGLEDFVIDMAISNITALSAVGSGTLTFKDTNGDPLAMAIQGTWTKFGSYNAAFSGTLGNVTFVSGDGTFDGHTGSVSMSFLSPQPWTGTVVDLVVTSNTGAPAWFTTAGGFSALGGSLDAHVVPVPAAMLLGVLGLGTAGLRLRKRS